MNKIRRPDSNIIVLDFSRKLNKNLIRIQFNEMLNFRTVNRQVKYIYKKKNKYSLYILMNFNGIWTFFSFCLTVNYILAKRAHMAQHPFSPAHKYNNTKKYIYIYLNEIINNFNTNWAEKEQRSNHFKRRRHSFHT